jgi:HEPN domain-containing protein
MAEHSKHVRLFKRIARERLNDAEFLREGGRNSAAVYLGGYGIECALKAAVLASVPRSHEIEVLGTFRGLAAHSFDHLRRQYLRSGGASLPQEIQEALADVSGWAVSQRYNPERVSAEETATFLEAARRIFNWIEDRL